MAFPAGRLPNQDEVRIFSGVQRPAKSLPLTPGTEQDLTDPANKINPCCTEILVTTAGNIVGRLAGDTVDRTYAAGIGTLTGLFVVIRSTSTAVGIIRQ